MNHYLFIHLFSSINAREWALGEIRDYTILNKLISDEGLTGIIGDGYTCQYCGERGKRLECDHVVPVSRGGSNEHENLVTACFACNRSKRAKTVEEWRGS